MALAVTVLNHHVFSGIWDPAHHGRLLSLLEVNVLLRNYSAANTFFFVMNLLLSTEPKC